MNRPSPGPLVGLTFALTAALMVTACGARGEPTSGAVRVSSNARFDVTVDRNRIYRSAPTEHGEIELAADVYRPVGPGPFAGLIFQHGGGFRAGSRAEPDVVRFARETAARGVVVASISYRLSSDRPVLTDLQVGDRAGPLDEVSLAAAAATEDLLSSLEWFAQEASELRVARGRIFLGGSSAGATAAMMAAYSADDLGAPRSQPIAGVVDLWGAFGFGVASVDHIEAGDPPIFVVHGDRDRLVPATWARSVVQRVEDLGIRADAAIVAGAGHGWTANGFFKEQRADGGPPLLERLAAFLNEA